MEYKKLSPDSYQIKPSERVTLTEMGNTIELKYMSHKNSKATVMKVSKDEYCVLDTGEIKEYQKKASCRVQSPESMRRTFRKITELVNTNVTNTDHVKFVTLTYAENMTDPTQLYNDFRKFNYFFTNYCIAGRLGKPEYIAIAEPQGRGAWHLHVFYIWDHKVAKIPYSDVRYLWGHGYIDIRRLKNLDNIAGYLIAYLTNMEINKDIAKNLDDKKVYTAEVDHKKKYFLKGARLSMYPSGFNILRYSRGIKKPGKCSIAYDHALELVEERGLSLKYQQCGELIADNNFKTLIKKEEYRK